MNYFSCTGLRLIVFLLLAWLNITFSRQICTAGYFNSSNSTSTSNCAPCAAGKYNDVLGASTCISCPAGKFSSVLAANSSKTCIMCPNNHSSSGAASTMITDCTCNPGYTGRNGGECIPCQPGSYKAVSGSGACVRCQSGSTSGLADTNCSCIAGYEPGNNDDLVRYDAGNAQGCPQPECPSNMILTDSSGLICGLRYNNSKDYWWIIAPSTPYSGIQLTFQKFKTELIHDVVKIYVCNDMSCCYNSSAPPAPNCLDRVPITKSGKIAAQSGDKCNTTLVSTNWNPLKVRSSTNIIKVVFTTDFSIKLEGWSAIWETFKPSCMTCPLGTYKTSLGQVPCLACDQGTYASSFASTTCILCPTGSYSPAGSGSCTCKAGYTSMRPYPHIIPDLCAFNTKPFVVLEYFRGSVCYTFGSDVYPTDQNLWWIIKTPVPNAAVRLAFGEDGNNNWIFRTKPKHDPVIVSECADISCNVTRKLIRVSGTVYPDPIWSVTGILKIEFSSNSDVGETGFIAAWETHPDGAQGEGCSPCPAGFYKGEPGPAICQGCTAGFYVPHSAATACLACTGDPQNYSATAASECGCNTGYRLDATAGSGGRGSCEACRAGTYKPEVGPGLGPVGGCLPCPVNTNSTIGSSLCRCDRGYYAITPPGSNSTQLPYTDIPIASLAARSKEGVGWICPAPSDPLPASLDLSDDPPTPVNLTDSSGLVCRYQPGPEEFWQWIIAPAVPNVQVKLTFTDRFDLVDDSSALIIYSCNTVDCDCITNSSGPTGKCQLLSTNVGSARPKVAISTTGYMLIQFCTNCRVYDYSWPMRYSEFPTSNNIGGGFEAYFQAQVGDMCTPCDPGYFSGSEGPKPCDPCTNGYFAATSGATSCDLCPATYTSLYSLGSSKCTCDLGYSSFNAEACYPCPVNTYSDVGGEEPCKPCAPNSEAISIGSEACVCQAGYTWLSLIKSQPVAEDSACFAPCKKTGCNRLEVIREGSGRICHLNYDNLEDIAWMISAPQPNAAMVLSFDVFEVELGFDEISVFSCPSIDACLNSTYKEMQEFVSDPDSYLTADGQPRARLLLTPEQGWLAISKGDMESYYGTVPSPLTVSDPVAKIFFHSDEFVTKKGLSARWVKLYGTSCSSCDAGKYKSVAGTSICVNCSAGTYSESPGSSQCLTCLAGTYSITPAATDVASCRPCPTGTVSAGGSNEKSDCKCLPGFYKIVDSDEDAGCLVCESGKFTTSADGGRCTDCPVQADSPKGSTSKTNCTCNAGYTGSNGGNCTECPPNSYKDQQGAAPCTKCSEGASAPPASRSPDDCICNAGYEPSPRAFSPAPPVTHQPCPPDGATLGTVSGTLCRRIYGPGESVTWHIAPRKGSALSLSPVYLNFTHFDTEPGYDEVLVYACPDASCSVPLLLVRNSGQALPAPIRVDSGIIRVTFRSDLSDQRSGFVAVWQTLGWGCQPCRLGAEKSESGQAKCQLCAPDTFAAAEGSIQCQRCPPNKVAPAGSTAVDNCMCNAGYSGPNGSNNCTACPPGTYKSVAGPASCELCASGKFSTATAASTPMVCSNCQPNARPAAGGSGGAEECVCIEGYFGDPDSDDCSGCPAGTFTPEANSIECKVCPAGTYSAAPAASACAPCPEGTYSAALGATAASVCKACPPMSTSPSRSTTRSQCACRRGYFAVAATSATTSLVCAACPPGKYKDSDAPGTLECVDCPANTYSAMRAAETVGVCTACPPNSFSLAGSDAVADCACSVGYTPDPSHSGICTPCARGKYKESAGAAPCRSCPDGTSTSGRGATSAAACSNCPAGTYLAGQQCTKCAAGKFSLITGATANDVCTNCPRGTFGSTEGATECTMCNAGGYSAILGATECLQCPDGSESSSVAGGSSCVCGFPSAGEITSPDQECVPFFPGPARAVWSLSALGDSCAAHCETLGLGCLSPQPAIDSEAKAAALANYTGAPCFQLAPSTSHLAPHRFTSQYSNTCYWSKSDSPSSSCGARSPYMQRFCACSATATQHRRRQIEIAPV